MVFCVGLWCFVVFSATLLEYRVNLKSESALGFVPIDYMSVVASASSEDFGLKLDLTVILHIHLHRTLFTRVFFSCICFIFTYLLLYISL